MYQKAASIFIYMQMFAKVNHVVNLKEKKADYKYLNFSRFVIITWSQTRISSQNAEMRRLFLK